VSFPRVVVDLGSHTFHWVIARGQAVDAFERRGLRVALAAGLSPAGDLAADAYDRAEAALAAMAAAIAPIPLAHRAVLGTATFRRLRDPAPLQALVARYLGLPARILSGEEEAALIWHGVQGWLPTQAPARCVLDIGGASTELAVGDAGALAEVLSLPLGCVVVSEGVGTGAGAFDRADRMVAEALAQAPLQPFRCPDGALVATGGSAISAQALGGVQGLPASPISAAYLDTLWCRLRGAGRPQAFLPGLPPGRERVLLGELALLRGLLRALGQAQVRLVPGALADGALLSLP
jgi:exopolyphosphatase/guanosine-5'-triphosphate,3'-diphosphate pyrophosphatase